MNLTQLELMAKHLAPVISKVVKSALDVREREIRTEYDGKIEDISKSIDDFRVSLPDFSAFTKKEEFNELGSKALSQFDEISESVVGLKSLISSSVDESEAKIKELIPDPVDLTGLAEKDFIESTYHNHKKEFLGSIASDPNVLSGFFDACDKRFGLSKSVERLESMPEPKDGENGKDGESVSIEEVKSLVDDAVSRLPLAKNGEDGKSVDISEVKLLVDEVVSKLPPAANGRDAIELEIQPSVDFSKSYPRGVYAIHGGGLIKSYMQTSGEKGWDTVLNGVSSVEYHQIDERTVKMLCKMTDGTEQSAEFNVPTIIDRGVFKPETDYLKGDAVTYGGSVWISQKDAPEGKPGVSKDWRLAVKKGRDGRDGSSK